ncbi:MAG: sulfurtransferase TusA family protein [Rhodospirillaceae bacterium]
MPDDGDSDVTTLDATGLSCPLPVLRARKALGRVAAGATLAIRATDRAAPADFEAFCREAGHGFLGVAEDAGVYTITLRKAGSSR